MNRASLVIMLAASMLATVGCASKNYVKQETTPIINKTNELDDLTAQNSKAIKDVDARAQAGIQQVNAAAAAADQKAQAAGQQAARRRPRPTTPRIALARCLMRSRISTTIMSSTKLRCTSASTRTF